MLGFLVFLGGGIGALARYLAGIAWVRIAGPTQPYLATAGVNVVGGLLMGALVGWLALKGAPGAERWRVLLGVGVLGGFTTFSSFALEAVGMLQRKAYLTAGLYIAGSVILSILALVLGLVLMRRALA